MQGKIKYEFTSKVWQHPASGGWFFASLPLGVATEIRQHLKWQEEGWGRIKATAKIGETQWDTALWFDTKHQTYLLPIKSQIRLKEKIDKDDLVEIQVYI